ncbi:MAG TPA: hypothetical protein VHV78_01680, partial [Gemmatimonadaceae bacterium]|nr:hypothetical protein [Gemmatimonadaceae bacterium]
TIGAVVGALRRRSLPRAPDAPAERIVLHVGIPLVLSIAIWATASIAAHTGSEQVLLPVAMHTLAGRPHTEGAAAPSFTYSRWDMPVKEICWRRKASIEHDSLDMSCARDYLEKAEPHPSIL